MSDRADAAAREARARHLDQAASQYAALRVFAKTITLAVVLALALRSFVYEPYNIPSASMRPTLQGGDYLFVAKYPYGISRYSLPLGLPLFEGRLLGRHPERGDVVVFKSPRDNRTEVIKRVIGLPGDRVRLVASLIELNGVPVTRRAAAGRIFIETLPAGRSYRVRELGPATGRDDTRPIIVPAGRYLVLGDNRDDSADSRFSVAEGGVGLIPAANLLGRADRIFFSTGRGLGAVRWSRIGMPL